MAQYQILHPAREYFDFGDFVLGTEIRFGMGRAHELEQNTFKQPHENLRKFGALPHSSPWFPAFPLDRKSLVK
jgi:hypothetical protein